MSSKADILNRIRRQQMTPTPHPDLHADWIRYPLPVIQFQEVVASVGGQVVGPVALHQLRDEIQRLPCLVQAAKIVCTVCELNLGNCDLQQVEDPHQLEDVDVAIVPGEFAVAENGAVWVPGQELKHRAVLFLAQHLVLVVNSSEILNNLHLAYERLSFLQAGYGVFISGPSKTADIEQSLVIGAHGPRSLTVMLIGQ